MMRLQALDLEDGHRIINVCFKDEDDLLRFLRVWKMMSEHRGESEWQAEEKNNYSKILTALHMEEGGNPVEGVISLIEELRVCKIDRDNAWGAFNRLRKAYAMVRDPTLDEEIKLLYDTAGAVANPCK